MLFSKGTSGNPKGRPKEKPMKDALLYMLQQPVSIKKKKDGEIIVSLGWPRKPTANQMLAHALIRAGFKENIEAIKEAFNRVDGKIAQPIMGSDDPDDAPIQIEDMSTKELARRIGFLLLEGSKPPKTKPLA